MTPIFFVLALIGLSYTYIGELLLSFLPYVVAFYFGFMFIITGIFLVIHIDLKRQNIYWFNWITIFFAFLLMFSFYFNMNVIAQPSVDEVNVLAVNLWYKNTHHSEMQEFFEDEEADIILVSEFTDTQHDALRNYLDSNYPYQSTQLSNLSKPYTGKAIFSKYLITEKQLNSPEFGELFQLVEVSHPSKTFDMTMVHTTAPVNQGYYDNRNKQLEYLGETMPSFFGDSTIVTGDFNTSPWSPRFVELSRKLGNEDIEVVDYNGFNFSWTFQPVSFFKSHIDHTFHTPDLQIRGYELKEFPGSDHKAQSFVVGL